MFAKLPTPFRWLHLTDLHFGDHGRNILWWRVREAFLRDLRQLLTDRKLIINLVVVTGDLVDKGNWANGTQELTEFFTLLQEPLVANGNPPFFFVPGNHDLTRCDVDFGQDAVIRAWDTNQQARDAFWGNKPKCVVGPLVKQSFEAYADTIARLVESETVRLCEGLRCGMLPGDSSATIDHHGQKIGVLGLNTTFLQVHAKNSVETVDIDVRQAIAAVEGKNLAHWRNSHSGCLIATHHTSSRFRDPAHFLDEIYDPDRFFVHLCGHEHDANHLRHLNAAKLRLTHGAGLRSTS